MLFNWSHERVCRVTQQGDSAQLHTSETPLAPGAKYGAKICRLVQARYGVD